MWFLLEQYTTANGGVHSNHLDYTDALANWLDQKWLELLDEFDDDFVQAAQKMHEHLKGSDNIDGLLPALRNALKENSIEGTQRVNDLFKNLGPGINDNSIDAVNHIINSY